MHFAESRLRKNNSEQEQTQHVHETNQNAVISRQNFPNIPTPADRIKDIIKTKEVFQEPYIAFKSNFKNLLTRGEAYRTILFGLGSE